MSPHKVLRLTQLVLCLGLLYIRQPIRLAELDELRDVLHDAVVEDRLQTGVLGSG